MCVQSMHVCVLRTGKEVQVGGGAGKEEMNIYLMLSMSHVSDVFTPISVITQQLR